MIDPAFAEQAIIVLQTQRNQAMDAVAIAEARVACLAAELAKAQTHIKELEGNKEEKK